MSTEAAPKPLTRDDEWAGIPVWNFRYKKSGYHHSQPLVLVWELANDWITDDYRVRDITPAELWHMWLRGHPVEEAAEAVHGPGARSIRWFVEGPGTFEGAPFTDTRVEAEMWRRSGEYSEAENVQWIRESHFLYHHTWPTSATTNERLAWEELPVIDKVWRTENVPALSWLKGGFIQEATGWKPTPLQPYVNITRLAAMHGLYIPGDLE